MKVARRLAALRHERHPVCLAAGFFDGLHSGHQAVLQRARQCAQALGGRVWVLTFDRHPLAVLRPGAAPPLLTTPHAKLELLAAFGVHGCLILPFTRALANLAPTAFLELLQRAAPTLHHLFVGANWRFGRHARGDVRLLARWFRARGIAVTPVPPVRWRGQPVSSTRIRNAIAAGNLAAATAMLRRPYALSAIVVRGRGMGRQLGYPTANLQLDNEVRPPCGVYAVRARCGGHWRDGILYYGRRPTFAGGQQPVFELHLFDWQARLYGRRVEVFLISRLRGDRRFASVRALAAQIARDVARARRSLRSAPAGSTCKNALQVAGRARIVTAKTRKERKRK